MIRPTHDTPDTCCYSFLPLDWPIENQPPLVTWPCWHVVSDSPDALLWDGIGYIPRICVIAHVWSTANGLSRHWFVMAVVLAWYGSPKSRWAIFVPYIEILFYWQRPRSQGRPQGYFRNPGNSEVQWHSGGGVAMPVYFGYPSHVCLWVCNSSLLLGVIFAQPFQHIGLCRLRQCLWSCSERTQARAWFDTCSSGAGSLAAAGEPPLGGG